MSETLYESLVARPDAAESIVAGIDAAPERRTELLQAALRLVDEFIHPAALLLTPSRDDALHEVFDLRRLAKSEFSGLLTGLLARSLPRLQEPPPDEVLSHALHAAGLEIASAEDRVRFFRAWIATRAGFVLRALLARLQDMPPAAPAAVAGEREILRAISERSLPSMERSVLDVVLNTPTG